MIYISNIMQKYQKLISLCYKLLAYLINIYVNMVRSSVIKIESKHRLLVELSPLQYFPK